MESRLSASTAPPTWPARVLGLLDALRPAPLTVDRRERARASIGAGLGLLLTALLCRWLGGATAPWWLVAPLGASAVLVFAVPASPLAQPWAVIGGNTVSAIVGVACARWIPDPAWAGAFAVAGAIAAMFATRSLHPPGGAMALTAVLLHATTFHFAWFPAFVNSAVMVLGGVAYNRLTGRDYPHAQRARHVAAAPGPVESQGRAFSSADLDAVLKRHNQVLDISRGDLEDLLNEAQMASYQRRLGELRCADVMSREVVAVHFGTLLQDAWRLMRRHRVKALPVVDTCNRVIGIITLADFMRHADLDVHEGFAERLRGFVKRTTTVHSDKPEVVGQIMTRQVRVASQHRPLSDLIALFSEGGHHHIPIVADNSLLVGMITQSDFVKALYRAASAA